MIPLPIIIAGLAFLVGCAEQKKNECTGDGTGKTGPCSKGPDGGDVPRDRDGDRVMDDVDLCPDDPNIGSPDGCPPHCEKDTDNDGINDCLDACPSEAGPIESNGCAESPPVQHDYYRLNELQSSSYLLAGAKGCAHAVAGNNSGASIIWSDGSQLMFKGPSGDRTLAAVQNPPLPINLCVVGAAAAFDNSDNLHAIWNEGEAGSRAYISYRKFAPDGSPLTDVIPVDSFPMPNLGANQDNIVASLSVDAIGTAHVTTLNRDKIQLTMLTPSGEVQSPITANERSIHIERNRNPFVASDATGRVAVVWQENTGEKGPIRRAIVEGENIDRGSVTDSLSAKSPSVAIAGDSIVYAWEDSGKIFFQAERKIGGSYEKFWPEPVPMYSSDTQYFENPKIVADSTSRILTSWAGRRSDAALFGAWYGWLPGLGAAATSDQPAASALDESLPVRWLSSSTSPSGRSTAILYPGQQPESWQLEEFEWSGTEAPALGGR